MRDEITSSDICIILIKISRRSKDCSKGRKIERYRSKNRSRRSKDRPKGRKIERCRSKNRSKGRKDQCVA